MTFMRRPAATSRQTPPELSALRVAAVALIAVFLLGAGLSLSAHPGYEIGVNWVSDLGVGNGAFFFNAGLWLGAVLLLVFFLKLRHFIAAPAASPFGGLAVGAGVLASLALAGIGLWPSGGALHVPVTTACFALLALAVFCCTAAFLALDLANFWTLASAALFLVFGGSLALHPTPFLEYNAVASVGGWVFTVAFGLQTR